MDCSNDTDGVLAPPSTAAEVSDLLTTWGIGLYEPCIRYIRFPLFKNMAPDLRIEFGYPITAIVGPNGSNKSSILRALQGCPEGQNIGLYWFGTPLDSVKGDERHRFIHGRWSESEGAVVESITIRRARTSPKTGEGSTDYFETDDPIRGDGMLPMPPSPSPLPPDRSETRWRPIQKPVEYFDFRSEISAFDKFFHHNDANTRGPIVRQSQQRRDRKELLVVKSKYLRKIIDRRSKSFKPGGKELVIRQTEDLTAEARSWISYILGRNYIKVTVVGHRAFKVSGTTALMWTQHLSYSEAWAGSGEFAVVQLVRAVMRCKVKTLLLLDEPEVSLYPGAQVRMMEFLGRMALEKKLQVVLSTHSPAIIQGLPPMAIKVLDRTPEGKVELRSQSSSPSEAFVALQHAFHRKTVVVEDRLAEEIVRHVLRRSGGASKLGSIDVKYIPGGSSTMRSRLLPDWALEGRTDVLLVLDGDMRFDFPPPPSKIAEADLEDHVKTLLGVKNIAKHIPSNSDGVKVDDLRTIIEWCRVFVRFLPGEEPDVWLAEAIDPAAEVPGDGKRWWDDKCRDDSGMLPEEPVPSDQRFRFQQSHLGGIQIDNSNGLDELQRALDEFISR